MKLFISSDIEGVAGVAAWSETEAGGRDAKWYEYFCAQMTREVGAVCEGALKSGVEGILVKDAHETGRNIDPLGLPEGVQLNRGWNGGLFSMVAGLSGNFDAVAFTGYHSAGGSAGNPLSHTMTLDVDEITINGRRASEFIIHSYIAGMLGVPVVFLSGDGALCREAQDFIPGITAVAVSEGDGNSSTSAHPKDAVEMVRAGIKRALKSDFRRCLVEMPANGFKVTIRYREHRKAFYNSFYPGAVQDDEKTVTFEHDDYHEVLRFFHFVL